MARSEFYHFQIFLQHIQKVVALPWIWVQFCLIVTNFQVSFRRRFSHKLQSCRIYLFSLGQLSTMLNYICGRYFHAEEHLAQRRADRPNHGISRQPKNPGLPRATTVARTSEDLWMWDGIRRREVVGTVSASALGSPSNVDKVTSSQGCDLICSYNLQMDGDYLFPGQRPSQSLLSGLPSANMKLYRVSSRVEGNLIASHP